MGIRFLKKLGNDQKWLHHQVGTKLKKKFSSVEKRTLSPFY